MPRAETYSKHLLLNLLDDLPEEQTTELYLFALFLKQRSALIAETFQEKNIKVLPASTLSTLSGRALLPGEETHYRILSVFMSYENV